MEWVESTGPSLEEAKEAALDRLGVHEDDAEFDILAEARTGLFGRVKEDARVRARVRPTAPRAKDDRRRGRGRDRRSGSDRAGGGRGRGNGGRGQGSGQGRGGDRGRGRGGDRSGRKAESANRLDDVRASGGSRSDGDPNGGRSSRGRDTRTGRGDGRRSDRSGGDGGKRKKENGSGTRNRKSQSRSEESAVSDDDQGPSLAEQAALAEEFVSGLAAEFGKNLTFSRDELVDGILRIEAAGDDIGLLVGRRGATAQAIDDLVRTVLQRAGGTTREGKVRVDIGGVRALRAKALSEFTRDLADRVRDSGTETALEPMGGADRKLVHDVVSEIDGVDTRSEGEDPHRRVVIVPVAGDT